MQDYDGKLGIYSKVSILTQRLETKFKDKYLEVFVFENSEKVDLSKLSYLIINLIDNKNSIEKIKSLITDLECKILVLFPLFVKAEEKYVFDTYIKDLLEINNNLGIILVPEILGDGVKYMPDQLSHDLIMQSLLSERIKIKNIEFLINAISLSKLVEIVVKETFSFGISGQVLALSGLKTNMRDFLIEYLQIDKSNIIFTKEKINYIELSYSTSLKVDFLSKLAVSATKNTFLNGIKEKEVNVVEKKPVKKKINEKYLNRILKLILSALILFSVPFFTLFVSIFFLYISLRFVSSNPAKSEKFISYSLKAVSSTRNISFGIPVYYNYSNIIYKSAFLFREVLELSKVGKEFGTKIMGDDTYDLSLYTDNISAILDRIHTDFGFLQSDINELNDLGGRKLKEYLTNAKIDISEHKNKVYATKLFSSRLSILLGMDKPMKYLILFQNNMELRPTGGFIGSFATMTFDKGRMSEIVVSDVYSADGQLKGHIDPPEPIRAYLGEGGWYMRDANWDPSFPDSAVKIEWFLNKEVGTEVDGVIAIDLSFVKSLLKITGPINLIDYNKTIDMDNLFTMTQEEVESDFFPGSIKKASFMTSLSKQLILELQLLRNDKYFILFKEIYKALEERHLQIYLHDFNAQESIKNLGYSGSVDMETNCGLRCFSDKYSLIDANLGVNKSNLYIKRSQEINLEVSKQKISHELLVTYENLAKEAVGNSGVYKSYTRLVLPVNAIVSGVRLYDITGNYEDLKYDVYEVDGRYEIGFLINILPNTSKRIQVVWDIKDNSLSNGGEFRLLVRKQAGTENDKLKVNIEDTDLSLTGRVPSVYTTDLTRDYKVKLFFK